MHGDLCSRFPRPRRHGTGSILPVVLAIFALATAGRGVVGAQDRAPLAAATITEHLGDRLPPDVALTDSDGSPVRLSSLIGDVPVVLTFAYYTCPMLCELGQDGAADAFARSGRRIGRDFRVATVSIDPRDTPALAREWHDRVVARLGASAEGTAWHVLVGREADVRRLADAVGFAYARDTDTGEYAHPTALFLLTPDGRIAEYVYGVTFDPPDIAAAIDRAAAGRTTTAIERFLTRCFHYVPSLRRHGQAVTWLLRLGGLTVTAIMGVLLLELRRRDRRRAAGERE